MDVMKEAMGVALSALTKFSGSRTADLLYLRRPTEQLAYYMTREGMRAASTVAQQFEAVRNLVQPERPPRPSKGKGLFDLTPTAEQTMFRESASRFAEETLLPAAEDADVACSAPDSLLQDSAELGLGMLTIPESLGGAGTERSPLTNALVAEDLSQGDMGLALAIMAPVGVSTALVEWGSAKQQSRYLPAFAEGYLPASIAISEPRALFDPADMQCRAEKKGAGYVLNGTKSLVPLIETAQIILTAAKLQGNGAQLFIVRRDTPGVTFEKDSGMGVRAGNLGKVILEDAQLEAEDLLGESPDACDLTELVDLARLGWCALAIGTAQSVLEYAITYCNERIAFGEPVSHRQSVAFMIANLRVELDCMRLLTYRAAALAEQGKPFHREAYLARVLCAEKGMEIGTNGVQLLGGHGYIKDHPMERWYRDLRTVGVVEGGLLI